MPDSFASVRFGNEDFLKGNALVLLHIAAVYGWRAGFYVDSGP